MKKIAWFLLVCALGCGQATAPEAIAAAVASEPTRESVATPTATGSAQSPAANLASDASLAFDRQVIRNAALQLSDWQPVQVTEEATRLAVENGGFLLDGRIESGRSSYTSRVVLRVPSTAFEKTLAALRPLGKIKEETITGQDVTDELVDTESRVRALRVLQARLISLLERTAALHDLLQVEQENARVGSEIERYAGRLRYLHERTSMSSIELTVTTPEPAPVAYKPEALQSRLEHAFKVSSHFCYGLFEDGAIALAYLLPTLVSGSVALLPVIWFRRRRRAQALATGQAYSAMCD